MHFENGQNAKNDLKPTNAKNAHEHEENITGAHAFVHFENEQMPNMLMKMRKMLGHMPLCILKMGRMPKMVEKQ